MNFHKIQEMGVSNYGNGKKYRVSEEQFSQAKLNLLYAIKAVCSLHPSEST